MELVKIIGSTEQILSMCESQQVPFADAYSHHVYEAWKLQVSNAYIILNIGVKFCEFYLLSKKVLVFEEWDRKGLQFQVMFKKPVMNVSFYPKLPTPAQARNRIKVATNIINIRNEFQGKQKSVEKQFSDSLNKFKTNVSSHSNISSCVLPSTVGSKNVIQCDITDFSESVRAILKRISSQVDNIHYIATVESIKSVKSFSSSIED